MGFGWIPSFILRCFCGRRRHFHSRNLREPDVEAGSATEPESEITEVSPSGSPVKTPNGLTISCVDSSSQAEFPVKSPNGLPIACVDSSSQTKFPEKPPNGFPIAAPESVVLEFKQSKPSVLSSTGLLTATQELDQSKSPVEKLNGLSTAIPESALSGFSQSEVSVTSSNELKTELEVVPQKSPGSNPIGTNACPSIIMQSQITVESGPASSVKSFNAGQKSVENHGVDRTGEGRKGQRCMEKDVSRKMHHHIG